MKKMITILENAILIENICCKAIINASGAELQ
jgi:hypothetical protein